MGLQNGSLILVNLDTNNALTHVTSATFQSSFDLTETTDNDDEGYTSYLQDAGKYGASISIDANADFDGTTGNVKSLADYLNSRSNVGFVFAVEPSYGAGAAELGTVQISGDALLNDLSIDSGTEDVCTLSGTLTVNGKWEVTVTS